MSSNVKVAVRCRPLSRKENEKSCLSCIQIENRKSVTVKDPKSKENEEAKTFAFDFAYGDDTTQQEVYADLGKPVVDRSLEGYNGTIFAYGQTGSGKTHSMMGSKEHPGIIPRLVEQLFHDINEASSENTK